MKSQQSSARPRVRNARGFAAMAMLAGMAALAIYFALGHMSSSQTASSGELILGQHLHSLVAFDRNLLVGTHGATAISRDGGESLKRVITLDGLDAMESAVSRSGTIVFLAGHNGARISRDGGTTWSDFSSGLPGSDVHGLAIDAADPDHVVAYLAGQGLFGTHDGGTSWKPLGPPPSEIMGTGIIQGRNVLIPAYPRGLLASTDEGATWRIIAPEIGGTTLAAVPSRPGMLLLSGAGPLFMSADGGHSWSERSLPSGANIVTADADGRFVSAGYTDEHRVLLWRSSDGENWTPVR